MSSILSAFPSLKLRSRDSKLRSGKRLRFTAGGCMRGWTTDSQSGSAKRQAVQGQEGNGTVMVGVQVEPGHVPEPALEKPQAHTKLIDLPDELLDGMLADLLGMKELCAIAQTCTKFRDIAARDHRWRAFFEERWGPPTPILQRAAELSGSWRTLFATKHIVERDAHPWIKPTPYELGAAVENISRSGLGIISPFAANPTSCEPINPATAESAEGKEHNLLFLVDGSGSVTEEDFGNMTSFMIYAWHNIVAMQPTGKVGIIQFSNDVRVELQPTSMESKAFAEHVEKMSRMNGGTNISSAIRKAGQVLGGTKGQGGHSAIVLLTDGRVDGHQATEAIEMASRLVDEVAGEVSLFAFGVGRGVDKQELLKIVGAGCSKPDESRYLGLCTYDEAPW